MLKRSRFILKVYTLGNIFSILLAILSFSFLTAQANFVSGQIVQAQSTGLQWVDKVTGARYYGPMDPSKNPNLIQIGGAEAPAPTGAGKDIGFVDRALGDDPLGGWDYWKGGTVSHLTSGLVWGGIAYGVVYFVSGFLGLDEFGT